MSPFTIYDIAVELAQAHIAFHRAVLDNDGTDDAQYQKICALQNALNDKAKAIAHIGHE